MDQIRFAAKESINGIGQIRAICAIHNPLAELAMPPISTRRVDRSMKNKTVNRFRPVHVHTSNVKKSVAMSCDQC